MSKNAILGLAAALCLVAAGVGAFIATRPAAVQLSSPEAGVSISPDMVQGGSSAPPAAAAGGAVPAPPVANLGSSMPPPVTGSPVPAQRTPTTTRSTQTTYTPSGPAARTTAPPAVPPAADSGWTSGDRTVPPATSTIPPPEPPVVAAPPAPLPPSPPEPQFDELVVTAESVLGLSVDSTVNSETARVEDPVEAHVTRDVRVGSMVAIPANTRVLGSVTAVDRGGKVKTRARLSVRFHTLVLADGTRTPIQTDAVLREGDSPGQEAAGKVGAAAAGGAILGAILGGGKGAAIGGSIGAAGGTAAVMAGKRNPAVLKAGTAVTVRLLQPVSIMVER